MQITKKLKLIWLLLLLVAVVAIQPQHTTSAVQHYHRPTLLIHGLAASSATYDHFVARAERTDRGQYALTARITPKNKVHLLGHWDPNDPHPLIKVVFIDNMASWQRNAMWLNHLLHVLKNKYNIRSFDAVAHSRGNLDLLMAYGQQHLLELKRAVLVSVPANGALGRGDELGANRILKDGQPKLERPAYHDLVHLRPTFPPGVHVLNIMGNDGNGTHSDGRVTNVSSRSLKPALGMRLASYHNLVVHGRFATHHTIIRRNAKVQRAAMNFLWH